jgi:hypothetical protein
VPKRNAPEPDYDVWEDPDWKKFAEHADKTLAPMVDDSAITLTLFNGKVDPKLAVETGYAVLLDKPFVFLVKTGTQVPDNLRRLAVRIIFFEDIADLSSIDKVNEIREAVDAANELRVLRS